MPIEGVSGVPQRGLTASEQTFSIIPPPSRADSSRANFFHYSTTVGRPEEATVSKQQVDQNDKNMSPLA